MGINEVAERFGQKPQTIRAYVRQGRLPKRQLVSGGRVVDVQFRGVSPREAITRKSEKP
jgi:Helix-turn-helix domain